MIDSMNVTMYHNEQTQSVTENDISNSDTEFGNFTA